MTTPSTSDWRAANTRADVFWTCDDGAERLSHDDLLDAVEEYIDGFLSPGCDTEAILRDQVSPLTIFGYTRCEVTDGHLEQLADDLAERLAELVGEDEWGDPDGNHEVLSDENRKAIEARFAAVLREERHRIVPWACEVTQTVEVEGDELVAMVREISPSWFDVEPTRSLTAPGR